MKSSPGFAANMLMFAAMAGALSLAAADVACSPSANKAIARAAVDLAVAECAIANADKPDDEVLAICGVLEDVAPAIKLLLRSHRDQASKMGAHYAGARDASAE